MARLGLARGRRIHETGTRLGITGIQETVDAIVADVNLGYEVQGANSGGSGVAGRVWKTNLPAITENGTLKSITFLIASTNNTTRNVKYALFRESDGAIIAESAESTIDTSFGSPVWVTLDCSGETLVSGELYSIGFLQESISTQRYWDTGQAGYYIHFKDVTYPTFETFPETDTDSSRLSGYITYTPETVVYSERLHVPLPKEFSAGYSEKTQPTDDLVIDWDNPLTKGLWGVYVYGQGVVNLVNGNPATLNSNSSLNITTEGGTLSGKDGAGHLALNNGAIGLNLTVLSRFSTLTATDQSFFDINNKFQFWADASGGTLKTGAWASVARYGSGGEIAIDGTYTTVGVQVLNGGSDRSAQNWVDGEIVSAYANIGGNGFGTDTVITVGGSFANGKFLVGELPFTFIWDRTLTDAEMAAISDRPYQIVKPSEPVSILIAGDEEPSANELISDDFSTDTLSDYIPITGVLTISGGALHGPTFGNAIAYHSTTIGTSDLYIEADVDLTGPDYSSLIFNYDPVDGSYYRVYAADSNWHLSKIDGGETYLGALAASSAGRMRIENNGGTITVAIGGTIQLTVVNADLTGYYVGVAINRGSTNPDFVIDNLNAGRLFDLQIYSKNVHLPLPKEFSDGFQGIGIKPAGNVEIDTSNPLTVGLKRYWLGDSLVSLTGHELTDQGSTVAVALPVLKDGEYVLNTQDNASLYEQVASEIVGSQNRTFLGKINHATTTDGNIFHITAVDGANGNNGERWTIRVNGSDGVRVEIQGSGITSNLPANSGEHFIGVRLDGTTLNDHTLFVDSQIEELTGSSSVVSTLAGHSFRLGARNNDQGSQTVENISWGAFWDRALTDAEIESIRLNPYQLLRPAVAPSILIDGDSEAITVSEITASQTEVGDIASAAFGAPSPVSITAANSETGDLTSASIQAPVPSNLTVIARYLINEASSGRTPTHLIDDTGNLNDLAINYETDKAVFIANSAGNGIDFTGTVNTASSAIAELSNISSNGNVGSSLSGATQVYVILQVGALIGHNNGMRLFAIGTNSGNTDFSIVAESSNLYIRWDQESGGLSQSVRANLLVSSLVEGDVVIFQVDTTQATSALSAFIYVNNVEQTLSSNSFNTTNASIQSAVNSTDRSISIGNRPSQNRNINGAVYYAEIGLGVLTSDQRALASTNIAANNDTDWNVVDAGISITATQTETGDITSATIKAPYAAVTITVGPDTNPTSWICDLPATVTSGDMLILSIILEGGSVSFNTPAGWTILGSDATGNAQGAVFIRESDGTEGGGTVTITQTGSVIRNHSSHVYRVSNANGTSGVELSTISISSATVDPASLTPSWGADDTLWIVFAGSVDDDVATLSASPNYIENLVDTATGQGTNDSARMASSFRTFNAVTEDPGVWTLDSSESMVVFTVGVQTTVLGNRITASQSEDGDSQTSSINNIVNISSSHAETGDLTVSLIENIAAVSSSNAESGDLTSASIGSVSNILSVQIENGDSSSSLVENVAGISSSQTENGDAIASSIDNISEISPIQIEDGDLTVASIEVVALEAEISASISEIGDFSGSSIEVVVGVSSGQAENGDSQLAQINPIADIASTQLDNGDSQAAQINSIADVSSSQIEDEDVSTSSFENIISIDSGLQETGDSNSASLKIAASISSSLNESGDTAFGSVGNSSNLLVALFESGDSAAASFRNVIGINSNQQEDGDSTAATAENTSSISSSDEDGDVQSANFENVISLFSSAVEGGDATISAINASGNANVFASIEETESSSAEFENVVSILANKIEDGDTASGNIENTVSFISSSQIEIEIASAEFNGVISIVVNVPEVGDDISAALDDGNPFVAPSYYTITFSDGLDSTITFKQDESYNINFGDSNYTIGMGD